VSCIAGAAILAYMSPQLLLSAYGVVLGIGALVAILFAIFFHHRHGGTIAGAVTLVLFVGGLSVGTFYAVWWYFFIHLAAQPLFSFQAAPPRQPAATAIIAPTATVLTETPPAHIAPIVVTPSPTTEVCGTAIVHTVAALAVRAEPTRASEQLTAISQGRTVEVLCDAPIEADDRVWRKVRVQAVEGYMSLRYLTIQQP
jgi:hypothetical protein